MVEKWQIIKRSEVFRKYSRAIEEVEVKMPNGTVSDFYIKKEAPAAAILAITKEGKIILVRQYRVGPDMIMDELPGGYLEGDESNIEGIERELLEETGYTGNISFVGSYSDDAYSTMRRYAFVATDCEKKQEISYEDKDNIEVVLVSFEEFDSLIKSGDMTDIEIAYSCLHYMGWLGRLSKYGASPS